VAKGDREPERARRQGLWRRRGLRVEGVPGLVLELAQAGGLEVERFADNGELAPALMEMVVVVERSSGFTHMCTIGSRGRFRT
jgi:hypothetical protein